MRRDHGRDGFTLVEVLVAFVVMAVVMIAVQRGVVAATRSAARAADVAAAARVARTILAAPLGDVDPVGGRTGRLAGREWAMRFEPLPFAPGTVEDGSGEAVVWSPVRVRLAVATGSGGPVEVETVRLTRAVP